MPILQATRLATVFPAGSHPGAYLVLIGSLLLCALAWGLALHYLRLLRALRLSEARHRLLADHAADVIWTMGLDGRLTYVSPSVAKLRGYLPEEVLHQAPADYFLPASALKAQAALLRAREAHRRGEPIPYWCDEMEQPCRDGSIVWTEVRATAMYGPDGRFLCIMGVTRDITERRRLQEQIQAQAARDALTGAWNRGRLEEQGRFEVERFVRYGHPLTVIFMDLDHFKRVNDQHGHGVGDEVLKGFCAVAQTCLRGMDLLGRWGGEEFLVLVPNTVLADALPVAERIRAALSAKPFPKAGAVTASLGLAQCRAGDTWDSLVARADEALYRAKEGGRNRVEAERETGENPLQPAGGGFLRLVWSEAYACGQPLIDAQHQDLFAEANGLLRMVLEHGPAAEVASAVEALLRAVATHFEAELRLLREAGYPGADAHALLHRDLLDKGEALASQHRQGALGPGDVFAYLAYEVVAQHLLKEDRLFFPVFQPRPADP